MSEGKLMFLKDGVRYRLWIPRTEKKFEEMVKEHSKEIFGENAVFFDLKKKIVSKAGIGGIPDGYIIIFSEPPVWCIVEAELSSHSAWEHIEPQVNKFFRGIKNPASQKEIVAALYADIRSDPITESYVKKMIGKGEVHHFLSSLISKPPIPVIVTDKKTEQLEEIYESLPEGTRTLEFKTYEREGVGLSVHAHLFEPLHPPKSPLRISEEDEMRVKKQLETLIKRFEKKGTHAWKGFGAVDKERYRLVGVELAKHAKTDESIFLAYLYKPDRHVKNMLMRKGYTEWFKDDTKGEYHWHAKSEKAKSHVLLFRTRGKEISPDALYVKFLKLVHELNAI